jgi:hypothetical protein
MARLAAAIRIAHGRNRPALLSGQPRLGDVPIHLIGAHVDLDHRTADVAGAARVSPHALLQDLLNRSDERLWGFLSNGLRLRILRDDAALTRQRNSGLTER